MMTLASTRATVGQQDRRNTTPIRIAITVDPYIPVPPKLYGGIERVVDFLVRGLHARGHTLTLFAHPDSVTPARLHSYGIPPHWGMRARLGELGQLGSALWSARHEFDIVHSFGRLASLLPILPLRSLPKIQSYQRDVVPWRSVHIASALGGRSILFTGCSTSVYANGPRGDSRWATVFNGVDVAKYDCRVSVDPDAPLVFLGRIERIKGAHNAIAIARGSGRRLVIAGNIVRDGDEPDYFDIEVAPHLGARVEYVGPVDDTQKNALLGSAAAFLMPIQWEEPFGIVMAEALACGTPVIGFPRGSVPEVVRSGVNGFSVPDVAGAIDAVRHLPSIDRAAVRADCERRFSAEAIVDGYERLYREMLAR